MLFRTSSDKPTSTATASEALQALIARSMPGADAESAALVGAVAGLLAIVAHADRTYTESERAHIREALGRVDGLEPGAAEAIESLLSERLAELAHEPLQTYARILYEGLERDGRYEILEVLLDLAAADDEVDMQETHLLRRIGRALGLSDDEYIAAQARHRERLKLLR